MKIIRRINTKNIEKSIDKKFNQLSEKTDNINNALDSRHFKLIDELETESKINILSHKRKIDELLKNSIYSFYVENGGYNIDELHLLLDYYMSKNDIGAMTKVIHIIENQRKVDDLISIGGINSNKNLTTLELYLLRNRYKLTEEKENFIKTEKAINAKYGINK